MSAGLGWWGGVALLLDEVRCSLADDGLVSGNPLEVEFGGCGV